MVGVSVIVGVRLGVWVRVGVEVMVGVSLGVGVSVCVGVRVGGGVRLGVKVAVRVGVWEGVAVTVAEALGLANSAATDNGAPHPLTSAAVTRVAAKLAARRRTTADLQSRASCVPGIMASLARILGGPETCSKETLVLSA
jgi:hypothetical protein